MIALRHQAICATGCPFGGRYIHCAKYVIDAQEKNPDIARLLFHVKHKRELQAKLVAKRTEKWISKNVFILYLRMNGTPAIAIRKQEGKLEYRDIRCIQAAADSNASKTHSLDSMLATIMSDYQSDDEKDDQEEVVDGADEHDVYAELGVNAQGPSDSVDVGGEGAEVEQVDIEEDGDNGDVQDTLGAIEVQRVAM